VEDAATLVAVTLARALARMPVAGTRAGLQSRTTPDAPAECPPWPIRGWRGSFPVR